MREIYSDTIAAIATARGFAGIHVLRVSGEKSFIITDKIFHGKVKIFRAQSHTIHFGKIVNRLKRQIVDEVLLAVFRKPNSYTGEDMVEISCHGSDYVSAQILELVIKAGARLAEPGEFTRRRVLNGKINITQAEAVLDLISAQNQTSHFAAMENLQGRLTGYIAELSNKIKNILVQLEHLLEFDETETTAYFSRLKRELHALWINLDATIQHNKNMRFFRSGIYCAIIGKPNVGKSSLFNRLVEADKAIITDIPGTTRDSLTETTVISGLTFHFIDTAGLKIIQRPKRTQKIEALGIKKSKNWLESADIILAVFDNADRLTNQDRLVYNSIKHKPYLLVINKIDRTSKINRQFFKPEKTIPVSAKYNQGINQLKNVLTNYFIKQTNRTNHDFVLNERQQKILEKANAYINQCQNEKYLETIIINLRNALDEMANVTSFVTNEQILDLIFNKFCVGK